MQAEIELLCTSKPQHLGCSTSMITPPLTCDPGRADRVNLPHVLSSHEEATVRCAKARPGSNSSSGSQAPVRSKTSGPHASAQHTADASRFHQSLWRWAPCRTHPISLNWDGRETCRSRRPWSVSVLVSVGFGIRYTLVRSRCVSLAREPIDSVGSCSSRSLVRVAVFPLRVGCPYS